MTRTISATASEVVVRGNFRKVAGERTRALSFRRMVPQGNPSSLLRPDAGFFIQRSVRISLIRRENEGS